MRSLASVSILTITRSLSGPANGLPPRASAPRTIRKGSEKSVRISRSQLPTSPAGGATSTRLMRRQASISRRYRPVMIVLPAPASSASRNRSGDRPSIRS